MTNRWVWQFLPTKEKNRILAAYADGKTIEWLCQSEWVECIKPIWSNTVAYRIKPTTDPITFENLSDAEKGALLLAEHNGEIVQIYSERHKEGWTKKSNRFMFNNHHQYRIKPAPKKTTIYFRKMECGVWTATGYKFAEYTLTFDEVDGVPITSSVKMEEVK